MDRPDLSTTKNVVPMIYAYTTPEIKRHDGWTKIGYTEQEVEKRINQQTQTADVLYNLEWKGNASYDDGTAEIFTDKDFHSYLRKKGINQEPGKNNEWFHISASDSNREFNLFRQNRGVIEDMPSVLSYTLREEQERAVKQTLEFFKNHKDAEFLWNAKPRFGKTLAVYDLIKRMKATNVLVVTNRPAIANSWYDDYVKFLGRESGYLFVSSTDSLKDKKYVLTREQYLNEINMNDDEDFGNCITFLSLQDLKGSKYFSSSGIDKLKEIRDMHWDILVVDEAHEGVDTLKTDVAFEKITRDATLHLSGTPFKALQNATFSDDAIFNWTYADEQNAKRDWYKEKDSHNPYESLPKLNMYTYQMSEIIKDEIEQGLKIDDEVEEYAFDLNEFFSTVNGKFKYDSSVNKFLDALTTQKKFPFSTEELRDEIKHSFWILNRVESAKLLAKKLEEHPVFHNYKIVLAAGDGKLDDDDEIKKSFDKVTEAIKENEKTITISVGQLTTGVTIPEWTAVLMLSNMKSPALYMQAAFRAQNPWLKREYKDGKMVWRRKENAYVFDFDPARTLIIYEEFANDLSKNTFGGRGNTDERKKNIKELLNFFPVIGEDEGGELVELDSEKVLSIPRRIRSVEVVRKGFMSNFLFQNISNIFSAPKFVKDLLNQFEPYKEPNTKKDIPTDEYAEVDKDGNVIVPEEKVIGKYTDLFGEKLTVENEEVAEELNKLSKSDDEDDDKNSYQKRINDVKEKCKEKLLDSIFNEATTGPDKYEFKIREEKNFRKILEKQFDKKFDKKFESYVIDRKEIEEKKKEELQNRNKTGETVEEIEEKYKKIFKEDDEKKYNEILEDLKNHEKEAKETLIIEAETKKGEEKNKKIEDTIREHLRGFSRTIPSFLMAYGNDDVTLENFDQIIPSDVFKEVTSISIEDFVFLRDGGTRKNPETDEDVHFEGKLFEPVVFNDSVKEFMNLREKLSNYFEEDTKEDIFDYIPPQKTNQIFTPKKIVVTMVDMLEEENPGCFDDPTKTFADLYMKSGLYIAEIVKRLYKSEGMKKSFPDEKERLRHIFEKQVYGLAPTEIIYNIAKNFILGFDNTANDFKHNLRMLDTLPYAKEGTLSAKLDEVYGE